MSPTGMQREADLRRRKAAVRNEQTSSDEESDASSTGRSGKGKATYINRAQRQHLQQRRALVTESQTDEDEDDDDDEDDEIDDDDDDSDAASTSAYSSVSEDSLAPIHEFGHTYHGSGRLFIPIDESEVKRLAIQHELYKLLLDGGLTATKLPNHPPHLLNRPGSSASSAGASMKGGLGSHMASSYSPSSGPYQILDVGAGSGIWACEMAQQNPHAKVYGIDLTSALLPQDVPPNVFFEIADVSEPWPQDRSYDFIMMRNLLGGGIRDWESLIRMAYSRLKPGGQLEFAEARPQWYDADEAEAGIPSGEGSNTGKAKNPEIGEASLQFEAVYKDLCAKMGIDMDPCPKVQAMLKEFRADGIKNVIHWLPVKPWGDDPVQRRKGELVEQLIGTGKCI